MSGLARLVEAASIIMVGSVLIALGVTLVLALRFGGSMLGRWARFRAARWTQAEIQSLPLTKLSALSPGPVRVQVMGTVQALWPKTSPSGQSYVVYQRGPQYDAAPFVLRTDDGAVWVQAERTSLEGHLEAEALLRNGEVVVVQGRVAELPRDAAAMLVPADVKLMLTDDLAGPLRMLLPNQEVERPSALLGLLGRTLAGSLLLPVLFCVLVLGSCLGIAYVVAPLP